MFNTSESRRVRICSINTSAIDDNSFKPLPDLPTAMLSTWSRRLATRTPLARSLASKSNADVLTEWMKGPARKLDAAAVADAELETLVLSLDDFAPGVLHVKLHRPKTVNAMNMQMWTELDQTFELVERDPSVKAVVLSGDGRAFSSGMDLSVFSTMQKLALEESCDGRKREMLMRAIDRFQRVVSAPERCRVPVVAAVHGACIGAGVDLITACDLRYCDASAIFSVKEVDLAIIADVGTLQRLPKLVGEQQAKELAFTGRNFGAVEAAAMGLVLKALPDQEQLLSHVGDVVAAIAAKSPLTVRGIKKTIHYQRDHSTRDSLEQVRYHNAAVLYSEDLATAIASVMSKTPAKFRDD